LLQSGKYPIFAVADGVTIELDKNNNYPNSSGAGEVAKIFCERAIKEAEKIYEQFDEFKIRQVFKKANAAVEVYNRTQERSKKTSNFWDFDLLAATGLSR